MIANRASCAVFKVSPQTQKSRRTVASAHGATTRRTHVAGRSAATHLHSRHAHASPLLRCIGRKRTPAGFNRALRVMGDAALAVEKTAQIVEGAERLILKMGESEIIVETGVVGKLASGAVMVKEGDTVLLTTACFDEGITGDGSFTPMMIVYSERMSAGGKTAGGFLKRDGRPRDPEVLISRLIDRPLRPMIKNGWSHDTQVLSWVMSYDGVRSTDAISITAAGIALALSEIPLSKPVAGVRVGWLPGAAAPIVNPTLEQMAESRLDLVLAGTEDAILMIEGFCDFMTEDQMLVALEMGQSAISTACKQIGEWVAKVGKEKKLDTLQTPPPSLDSQLGDLVGAELEAALRVKTKKGREVAMKAVKKVAMDTFVAMDTLVEGASDVPAESDEDEQSSDDLDEQNVFKGQDVSSAFKRAASRTMRTLLIKEGLRSDGRSPSDVRPISSSAGLLPRVHGSSLFTRGETQAIATCTLGTAKDGQRVDCLTVDEDKQFYLHYFFPPSSVGETGRVGGAGRREIGHGMLAERALAPILPQADEFPYSVRIESHITESNGSSSMASVCAGCLAMVDAGVPVKRMVAGVAMGLVLDESSGELHYEVLTDILGSEDALGDMDFKVAGDAEGITAFQMDIKVEGITLGIMRSALAAAKVGRVHILKEMAQCSPPPRAALGAYTPRITRFSINTKYIGELIGPGGKVIKKMVETFGVTSIDINQEGEVSVCGSEEAVAVCVQDIMARTEEPEIGRTYFDCEVKTVVEFGVFVELLPGKDALVHVSELALERITDPKPLFSPGDRMDVKLLEINGRGQLRVSRKVLLEGYTGGDDDDSDYTPPPPAPRPPRPTDRDQDRPKIVRKKAE